MIGSFATACGFVQAREGLYSDDPDDPGNYVSNRARVGPLVGSWCGISAATGASYLAPLPITAEIMRVFGLPNWTAIARTRFWKPLDCDRLPAGIDLSLFDHGFNTGAEQSARLLQTIVGCGKIDGDVGPITLKQLAVAQPRLLIDHCNAPSIHILQQALGLRTDGVWGPASQKAIAAHPNGANLMVISALAAAQSDSYRKDANFTRYGAGWESRVDFRQQAALALALAPATPPDLPEALV